MLFAAVMGAMGWGPGVIWLFWECSYSQDHEVSGCRSHSPSLRLSLTLHLRESRRAIASLPSQFHRYFYPRMGYLYLKKQTAISLVL